MGPVGLSLVPLDRLVSWATPHTPPETKEMNSECVRMHPRTSCVACYNAVSLHTGRGRNSKHLEQKFAVNTASDYILKGMYKRGGGFFFLSTGLLNHS